jgi:putative intracellular protease/amidase
MASRTLQQKPSAPRLVSRRLLQKFGVHPADPEATTLDMRGTRALCIATNHGVLDIGVATGVFASELTVPYYAFLDAGMTVDVASPRGGIVPVDPLSMDATIRTPDDDRLLGDDTFRDQLARSLAIADVDFTTYDIVYFAGGWGAAFDLGQSALLGRKVSEAWAAGRVVGGICHGPLGLLQARTADGQLLVKGRRLTAVTDKQVRELGVAITPLHPESALRAAGAIFEAETHPARDFFANHVVADGNLVTGQNQNAGPMVARLMMQRVLANRGAGAARPRRAMAGVALLAALLAASPAAAQLNGENLLGDMGVKSGTQPEPGVYLSNIYYRYDARTLTGPDGERVQIDPTGAASQTIQASVPLAYWVSKTKVLGGNFAAMAVVPVAKGALEAPGFGLSEEISTGLSDLYVMPAQLGWHFARADVMAGVGLFAPTGRYSAGADDNLGKGMWSYEVSGGGTVYMDKGRSISVATMAYWETHSKKQGEVQLGPATVRDVKVGQLLTLEGGAGKSFLRGAASVGVAYYAQWKLTADDLGAPLPAVAPGLPRHRVFGVGPDVTVPIATRSRLIALVNARYLWEHGSQVKTQGQTLMLTATFPVGGIRIPASK